MILQADFALMSGAFLYHEKSVLRDFALISGLSLHLVPLKADSNVLCRPKIMDNITVEPLYNDSIGLAKKCHYMRADALNGMFYLVK